MKPFAQIAFVAARRSALFLAPGAVRWPARRPARPAAGVLALAGTIARLATLAVLLLLPVHATASAIRCPETLAESALADRLPAGWELRSVPGELAVQRAAFYDGDPAGQGTHAPQATRRAGSTETSTYVFAGDGESAWIGCFYGDTSAVVTRRLPADVRQCVTRTHLSHLGEPLRLLSVDCV